MTATERKRLSVALVGHQGCGKSTLLGQLLWLVGYVDATQMKKVEAAVAQRDKRSARLAMVRFMLSGKSSQQQRWSRFRALSLCNGLFQGCMYLRVRLGAASNQACFIALQT
jgi:ABC-type cobalamin/Fe3+-siderophores transport system ATPase subunit